ncbi:MAG TPA: PIG-L family deacetylase [Mucilaginibacter sp.]
MEHQKTVAIIIAHPDDEILWCGGTLIDHPEWECFVICLCRKNDPDRSPRFYRVLEKINAKGAMADLDDGPEQLPLDQHNIKRVIKALMPPNHYDLVISHSPAGEYTRHRRHEEVSEAVIHLWHTGQIDIAELWTFAYGDGGGKHLPQPIQTADLYFNLTNDTWQKKYELINTEYNFSKDSWEARTTPMAEAFWRFPNSTSAMNRLAAEQNL